MKLSRESTIIAMIGLADLVTTLIMVHVRGAWEGNPIFEYYLAKGDLWFIAMKAVFIMAPIFLLELARRHRPVFTQWASRAAILAYLGLYIVGVVRLNPAILQREGLESGTNGAVNITAMSPDFMNTQIVQWRKYVTDHGYRLNGAYHTGGYGDY